MDQDRLYFLIDKLNVGTISDAEHSELLAYYNSHQLSHTWDTGKMGEQEEVKKRIYQQVVASEALSEDTPVFRMSTFNKVAAACIALVLLGWFSYNYFLSEPELLVVKSGDMTQEVVLPDGSTVTLNINSQITYPRNFDEQQRRVEFVGEGFFEVQADSVRPFLIATDHVQVRVLGTTFNLKAYEEDSTVETSLISGKIEVLSGDGNNTLSVLEPEQKFIADKKQMISARDAVADMLKHVEVVPIAYIDPGKNDVVDIAWKEGKLGFNSSTLEDISRMMKRKYNVDIIFENAEKAQFRYSATFDQETVPEILEALRLVKHFNFRKEGDAILIY